MKEVIACHKSSVSIEPMLLGIQSCQEFQFLSSSSKSVLQFNGRSQSTLCVFIQNVNSHSFRELDCSYLQIRRCGAWVHHCCSTILKPWKYVLDRRIDTFNTSTHSIVYHDFALCCSTGAGLLCHRSLRILHLPQQYYSSAPQVLTSPTSFLIEEHEIKLKQLFPKCSLAEVFCFSLRLSFLFCQLFSLF